jgi:hypothetical protein
MRFGRQGPYAPKCCGASVRPRKAGDALQHPVFYLVIAQGP